MNRVIKWKGVFARGRALGAIAVATLLMFVASSSLAQFGVGSQFGKNKIRYGDFDWKTYNAPHFKVYYYPKTEDQLERVVSLAESAYDRLSLEFDFRIQEPTPLLLYATHSEFLQTNLLGPTFLPEGVAAFATNARFRMVLPIDMPDAQLYELILHELTHIFQYHILFQGSLGKAITFNPPTWLMEGMASYYAEDESTSDQMYLRDAVVNDLVPPISQTNVQGFFAYRFGHAAFDFMEERWGKEGVRDFLFEFRSTIGSRVGRAIERAFRMDPEDFDIEFRRWLRGRYLPELVQTGEPSDFGRPFRTEAGGSQEVSPAASPSGDLVAAFSTYQSDLDIVLFDAEERELIRNLTKGFTTDFRNLKTQHLTAPRAQGRDLTFSPDGNRVAAFARKEASFSLAIINVLKGGVERVVDMDIEQQTAPAWSADGKSIAFAGSRNNDFDIFLLNLDTLSIRNLTRDDTYDAAPAFSPDGEKLVFVSVVDGAGQLFELDLANPSERRRLTSDEFHNTDPVYSSDSQTVYFTSDRTGAENIFGLDLAKRELRQYTNAITGCFQPTVLPQPGGGDRLVYTGYWRSRFDLYESEIEEPIEVTQLGPPPGADEPVPTFEPDIQVAIDEGAKEENRGFRLFLEDAQTYVGVDDDQTLLGSVVLQFSDFFGDRRLIGLFQSIESFSNFNVTYSDLSRRWQWSASLFDDRTFFIGQQFLDGTVRRGREAYQLTGALGTVAYPFSFYRRFEVSLGYYLRDINFQSFVVDSNGRLVVDDAGNAIPEIQPREDDFPQLGIAWISDTTIFNQSGPSAGHRVRLGATYAPDLDDTGTLTSSLDLDARKYFPLTRRSNFAVRLWGSWRDGNFATPVYFGGLDTVRGYDFRDIVGDRGFFANFELRFPLIDLFVTPVLAFQGIQGRIFLDVGGAWFDEVQDFEFYSSDTDRLQDGLASYGFGLTVRFFGVDLHFDFARRWDLEESSDTKSTFWIGQRF